MSPSRAPIVCWLLSREWRDTERGVEVTLSAISEEGPVEVHARVEPVFFVPRRVPDEATRALCLRRREVQLRALYGEDVDALYFERQRDLEHARESLRREDVALFESDVKPSDRLLMERFITSAFAVSGAREEVPLADGTTLTIVRDARLERLDRSGRDAIPLLRVASLDLETDGVDGPLVAFAFVVSGRAPVAARERVVVVRPAGFHEEALDDADPLRLVEDERALLVALFAELERIDPDLVIGWNVVEFDLQVLEARARAHGIPFAFGRRGARAHVLPSSRGRPAMARVPGRVVLDGIATLKNATWCFERYSLEHVSQTLFGRGKKLDARAQSKQEKIDEIRRMAREDPRALAAYNLEDARLVVDVFEATDLLGFAFSRAELVGAPLDRRGGAVAALDHLYLPRLHREGFVAPDVPRVRDVPASPGGEVLESVPGLHRDVLTFDFRSLYPSLIRTFFIDPLGLARGLFGGLSEEALVPGFDGARFAREPSILPTIIERLTVARAEARAAGNEALARAIKIQMNSFYGVLGTPGCRFFDPRLVRSITRRGHEIIHRARRLFEDEGLEVLYGDTDSLFVLVRDFRGERASDLGQALAARANATLAAELEARWGITSALELRLDQHFEVFLMPTVRGGQVGSKKRYAGLVRREDGSRELVIRGLEAIRTDWTPLARRVQRELLERVFAGEPWREWLRGVHDVLLAGALDDELVYRKRLRHSLDAYDSAPPHVRAARLRDELGEASDASDAEIEYVMTSRGPLPLEALAGARAEGVTIDHEHYVEKQLAPACDVVLPLFDTSYERLFGKQLSLF